MSKRNFYNCLFFLIPLIYFLSLPINTGDLAVWIAQGRYFLQTGHILRHDIYSVLPTSELIYPVGSSILYAFIHLLTGLIGVSLFHKFIVLLISLIWFKTSLNGPQSPWSRVSIFIVLCTWFGTSMFCIDRPALLAMLPLVLSFTILQKEDDLIWKDLILLNLINIIWLNLHGSWVLLILMYSWRESLLILICQRRFKWKAIIGFVTLAFSSLLSPFGYKMFPYVLETAMVSKERGIDEWAMTSINGIYDSQSLIYYTLFIFVIIFTLYLLNVHHSKAKAVLASPFMMLLLLGLFNVRNTVLAFFVLIPFASQFQLIPKEKNDNTIKALNAVMVTCLAFLLIAFLPILKPWSKILLPANKKSIFDHSSPFLFATYLNQTTDSDPVFNDWVYGSFLILSQKHRIFIDTRNIIYSRDGLNEYLQVVSGKNSWESILTKYHIKYIILNKKIRPKLITQINNSSNWSVAMQDSDTILYQKK